MKIIALIRSLNEHEMIDACCEAYQFCDEILIADGGSVDDTVSRALKHDKVKVRTFDEKVELKNGIWRNPDYKHLNFLYDWGREEGADWMISQDCDQRPNKHLKEHAREYLESINDSQFDFLMPIQIFLWKETQYFPTMTRAGSGWMHGIWAHRASIGMTAIDKMPHYEFQVNGKIIDPTKDGTGFEVDPPSCYLHHGWVSDEKVDNMLHYYRDSGLIPNMAHPFIIANSRPSPIEDWMVE